MAAMRRVGQRWGLAIGLATLIFGVVDVAVRMQAFFFPTETSGGEMAFWLPIYSLGLIPLVALVLHTILGVAARDSSSA